MVSIYTIKLNIKDATIVSTGCFFYEVSPYCSINRLLL
jgi:hypothetical protein